MEEMDVDDPADISINLWSYYGDEGFGRAVAEQWETNLGIQVNVSTRELDAFWETLSSCSD